MKNFDNYDYRTTCMAKLLDRAQEILTVYNIVSLIQAFLYFFRSKFNGWFFSC